MKNSINIIKTALMNYVNDSSGDGSEETKEIEKAWETIVPHFKEVFPKKVMIEKLIFDTVS
jgi:hypothetical protein